MVQSPLFYMIAFAYKEHVDLLINEGADVNAMHDGGKTLLDTALLWNYPETAALLRKHGAKTGEGMKKLKGNETTTTHNNRIRGAGGVFNK